MTSTPLTCFRGDTLNLAIIVSRNGAIYNLATATLTFTLKASTDDPDSAALAVSKTGGAGITVTSAAAGAATIVVSSTIMGTLPVGQTLYWDVQLLDNGETATVALGTLTLQQDVTLSTT